MFLPHETAMSSTSKCNCDALLQLFVASQSVCAQEAEAALGILPSKADTAHLKHLLLYRSFALTGVASLRGTSRLQHLDGTLFAVLCL
jgi:hypothetical protein